METPLQFRPVLDGWFIGSGLSAFLQRSLSVRLHRAVFTGWEGGDHRVSAI